VLVVVRVRWFGGSVLRQTIPTTNVIPVILY